VIVMKLLMLSLATKKNIIKIRVKYFGEVQVREYMVGYID
jgi:hypothetical protein